MGALQGPRDVRFRLSGSAPRVRAGNGTRTVSAALAV